MMDKYIKITVEEFDALKSKEAVTIKLAGCMMGNTDELTLYVGRRSRSKKYGYEKLTLTRTAGKAERKDLARFSTIHLYKRKSYSGGVGVSCAIGDMAAMVVSFNGRTADSE